MAKKSSGSFWGGGGRSGGYQKAWWEDDDTFDDYSSGKQSTGQPWWKSSYSYKKDKTNIVDPELDWMTKSDVRWGVSNFVNTLPQELQDLYRKGAIPEEVIEDIFKSYNYFAEDIALINTDKPEHAWKVKLLDKVSNHYLKTITRDNDLYSSIVTRNITGALLQLLQNLQNSKNDGKGSGKNGAYTLQDLLDQIGQGTLDKALQEALDRATQQIQNVGERLCDMVGGKEASKMGTDIKTLELLQEIDAFSKMITVRPEQLSKFIKGCYKRIVSYYNPSSTMYEEPFLEAESIEGLDELEQLMPIFRMANLEDMVIQAFKSNFKFDIYIDASGSMESTIKFGEKRITLYNLCRYVAIKLHSMGLVKDIYLFETSVKKMDNVFHLMKAKWGGGTNFNAVIDNVRKTGMSSVILTDLCDNIGSYNRECYFIGVQTFRPQGTDEVIGAYAREKQFMLFDGTGNFRIPIRGKDY